MLTTKQLRRIIRESLIPMQVIVDNQWSDDDGETWNGNGEIARGDLSSVLNHPELQNYGQADEVDLWEEDQNLWILDVGYFSDPEDMQRLIFKFNRRPADEELKMIGQYIGFVNWDE